MPSLPAVTGPELIKALQKAGFELKRTSGSHHVMRHPDGRGRRTSLADMLGTSPSVQGLGIIHRMAAAAPEPTSGPSHRVPDKNLKAIRAAILPEEQGDFDREYRKVMATATEDLDLAPVLEFVERWWRVAVLSSDADRHRAARDVVTRLNRGESVVTVSAMEMIEARLAKDR
jgi:Family of unknown function (DUF6247)/HicA toxin of bacterial toxin-antitoxin,